jgi:hypothetical protein
MDQPAISRQDLLSGRVSLGLRLVTVYEDGTGQRTRFVLHQTFQLLQYHPALEVLESTEMVSYGLRYIDGNLYVCRIHTVRVDAEILPPRATGEAEAGGVVRIMGWGLYSVPSQGVEIRSQLPSGQNFWVWMDTWNPNIEMRVEMDRFVEHLRGAGSNEGYTLVDGAFILVTREGLRIPISGERTPAEVGLREGDFVQYEGVWYGSLEE